MEPTPKNNPEQNQQTDRENKIQSLLDREITPILPFEFEILQAKIQRSNISNEAFFKLFGVEKDEATSDDSNNIIDTESRKAIDFLKRSILIDYPGSEINTVTLGSQFTAEYIFPDGSTDLETYILTGTDHEDYGKILTAKITSPIGRLVFGAKVGDIVSLPLDISKDQFVSVKIIDIEQVN